ncbi:MAG: GntR family transcriptional regulator [Sedimentibacter sp.]|uniref:GntR family transcriptional regulator n=1 Tax=Sedimentibacter sp. TaxID=1960295 RepID=UPI0031598C57
MNAHKEENKIKTNSKIAYDIIKNKILRCEYLPGQLLSEKEIVEELQMSRTPARQALNILAGENLISIISNKGIQITQISEKKVKEVTEIRVMLEKLMIEKAIDNITDKDLEMLDCLHEKLKNDLNRTDALAIFEAGKNIHQFIADIADDETLNTIIKILRNDSSRGYIYFLKNKFQRSSQEQIRIIKDSLRTSHEDILHALREKNKEKAVEAIARDVTIFKELI